MYIHTYILLGSGHKRNIGEKTKKSGGGPYWIRLVVAALGRRRRRIYVVLVETCVGKEIPIQVLCAAKWENKLDFTLSYSEMLFGVVPRAYGPCVWQQQMEKVSTFLNTQPFVCSFHLARYYAQKIPTLLLYEEKYT